MGPSRNRREKARQPYLERYTKEERRKHWEDREDRRRDGMNKQQRRNARIKEGEFFCFSCLERNFFVRGIMRFLDPLILVYVISRSLQDD